MKEIKGFEGKYYITEDGRIFSNKGKELKHQVNKGGYHTVNLRDYNQKQFCMLVHRLVALTYIDNSDNLPQVNHKDENKDNNSVDNLEWCNAAYNNTYGTRVFRAKRKKSKKIYMFDTRNNKELYFNSIIECADYLNVEATSVRRYRDGLRQTIAGFKPIIKQLN